MMGFLKLECEEMGATIIYATCVCNMMQFVEASCLCTIGHQILLPSL